MHSKLIVFVTMLAVLSTAGCGSNGSPNNGPGGPTQAPVQPTAFEGAPGKFAGRYSYVKNACSVQIGTHTFTSCSANIMIKQTAGLLQVTGDVWVNQANASAKHFHGRTDYSFTIAGKQLFRAEVPMGVIGQDGFYYSVGDRDFHFARTTDIGTSQFVGAFEIDGTGEVAIATISLKHGFQEQSSNSRVRK